MPLSLVLQTWLNTECWGSILSHCWALGKVRRYQHQSHHALNHKVLCHEATCCGSHTSQQNAGFLWGFPLRPFSSAQGPLQFAAVCPRLMQYQPRALPAQNCVACGPLESSRLVPHHTVTTLWKASDIRQFGESFVGNVRHSVRLCAPAMQLCSLSQEIGQGTACGVRSWSRALLRAVS